MSSSLDIADLFLTGAGDGYPYDADGFGVPVNGQTGLDVNKTDDISQNAEKSLSAEEIAEIQKGIERGAELGFHGPVYVSQEEYEAFGI